jgi:hypothetical protein
LCCVSPPCRGMPRSTAAAGVQRLLEQSPNGQHPIAAVIAEPVDLPVRPPMRPRCGGPAAAVWQLHGVGRQLLLLGVQPPQCQPPFGQHPTAAVIAEQADFPVRPPVPRAGAALLPQCGSCMSRADSCCCWVCSDFHNNRLTGSIPHQLSSLSKLTSLYARPCLVPVRPCCRSVPVRPFAMLEHLRAVSGTGRRPPLACSNFGNNHLTGSIPSQMSSLSKLTFLCVR